MFLTFNKEYSLKSLKTIVTAHQLADSRGYMDVNKLIEEAGKAKILFEIAGAPHICVEDWDRHIQKTAARQLSSRRKSSSTLADTDQLGIINSNLKRLPESIRIKERALRAKNGLYRSATSDNEKYILSGEISRLEVELERHRENLKKAQERQKQILTQRAAELKALESQNKESGDQTIRQNDH